MVKFIYMQLNSDIFYNFYKKLFFKAEIDFHQMKPFDNKLN